jgi:hypothetical protein
MAPPVAYGRPVMDVLDRAATLSSVWYLTCALVGFAGLMITCAHLHPLHHIMAALASWGFPMACIMAIHMSFQSWVHTLAIKEIAQRDSAYYQARAAEDARANAEQQAETVRSLQEALSRFADNPNDVAVALWQEGPHMFASVATNARVRAALEHHERLNEEAAGGGNPFSHHRPARSPARTRPAPPPLLPPPAFGEPLQEAALGAWRRAQDKDGEGEGEGEGDGEEVSA